MGGTITVYMNFEGAWPSLYIKSLCTPLIRYSVGISKKILLIILFSDAIWNAWAKIARANPKSFLLLSAVYLFSK